jgi:hypothetical protein
MPQNVRLQEGVKVLGYFAMVFGQNQHPGVRLEVEFPNPANVMVTTPQHPNAG